MRLATFVRDGRERFGLVLPHPVTGSDWVFDPAAVESQLALYASRGTSPFAVTKPTFLGSAWPETLVDFLAAGDAATSALRRLSDYLQRFLESGDQYILNAAAWPVADVTLRAPVPRPRLFFGLVQNSPTVWRHDPARTHINLFPQGHQRPQGAVLGPGDPLILPYAEQVQGGWNPELGVIIGTGGRDIPVERAMRHVAGLTVVSDVTFDYFRRTMFEQPGPYDWFEDAMSSWGDKKSDGRSPMGPYLVTLDEVGNPYDLLIYTRQDGFLRDRSHTGAMNLSIERTISWLSSFRTLHPGDVIHMGTMGYDGSPVGDELSAGTVIESEIEKVGVLRNPVSIEAADAPTEPRRRWQAVPNVRDLLASGADAITMGDWTSEKARHFWIAFGNYAGAGLAERPYPRFLNAPNTALAASGTAVEIPERARTISLGCELACVVGRLTSQATEAEAADAIIGYAALAVLHDSSFADAITEPATPQERYLPAVYARWADGFNILSDALTTVGDVTSRVCRAGIDSVGEVTANTADYLVSAPQLMAFISRYITLYPGDVVTLGRLGDLLTIPSDVLAAGARGYAEIEGIGRVSFVLKRRVADT